MNRELKSETMRFLLWSMLYQVIAFFAMNWAVLMANVMLYSNDPDFGTAFSVALLNIIIFTIPNLLGFFTASSTTKNGGEKPSWNTFFIVEGVMAAVFFGILLFL